jgi:glutamate synthase (NADPH/NADH) large chain
MAGYPLAHAAMMMIPEAWEQHELMDERRRAFYEYHAAMLEPWDGPAAMVFTDGKQIGATLDRNGLRPARYIVTDDDLVVMARRVRRAADPREPHRQEVAPAARQDVPDRPGAGPHHRRRGTEEPVRLGQALPAVDRERAHPARLDRGRGQQPPAFTESLLDRQQAFGYTQEDIKFLLAPMATAGEEGHRLDGQRQPAGRAVGQEQAAVQLLQAAVRAGDQPADRPDPRGDRDVAEQLHRPQAQPAGHQRGQPADAPGGRAAGARLRRHGAPARDREAHPRQVQELHARHHLPAGLGREGVEAKLASLCAEASTRSRAATTS